MGVCGNTNNINIVSMKERKKDKDRINQVQIEDSHMIKIDKNMYKVGPSVCKIKCLNRNGTGFFIKIKKSNEEESCYLMTNEHVLTKEIVELKKNMYVYYDFETKEKKINLNKDKRFIKEFTEMDLDIIVIEILEEDNIDKKYFLSPYMGNISEGLEGSNIYITQFPKGENLTYSKGKIIRIENYELTHNSTTDIGSSGSPIFLQNSSEVIGIHKQAHEKKPENYGNFIYPIIKSIKSNNKNGVCYIGKWLNGMRHGKGSLYNRKGNTIYEGDFINDKFEGDGKYYWEDGQYYIGQFLNGLKHGKGIIYYKNGHIKYEGDFIKENLEGDGKYYYENGEYYIGHFLNGQRDGKGTIYYKNGKIKYEGDFKEDKTEGNGKFIWEDGEYYIGQFLNSQSHGKGIEYYKDGNIKYDGDFIKDKHEGNGKYIWKDGEYYIGEYFNGLRHGKGKIYYKNGHIKYEGDFKEDKFEGNGRYNFENGEYYIGEYSKDQRNGKGILYDKNGNIKYEGEFINDKFNK